MGAEGNVDNPNVVGEDKGGKEGRWLSLNDVSGGIGYDRVG
jgi:hypothetical protein